MSLTTRMKACAERFGMCLRPCPFCGGKAVIDGDEDPDAALEQTTQYYTLGCITAGCREYIYSQNTGYPTGQVRSQIDLWNRRPRKQ